MEDGKPTATPPFLPQSMQLITCLRRYSVAQLQQLMGLSETLASRNHARFQAFAPRCTPANSRAAIVAFQGDVYDGLDAPSLPEAALARARGSLRILSGLYGVLRPFDRIQPYRLEMKTRLPNPAGPNLILFWRALLTQHLAQEGDAKTLWVNLASEEYAKAVDMRALLGTLVTPQFKEKKAGTYVILGLFAKRARGRMARHLLLHGPKALRDFAEDGYRYAPELSSPSAPVFARG